MAYRWFSIPALKLTQRPATGSKSVQFIQRGMSASCTVLPEVNNALGREADEKIDIDPSYC